MAPTSVQCSDWRKGWMLTLSALLLVLRTSADDTFFPDEKAYVSVADLALISTETAAPDNVKEMTLETMARTFSELPRRKSDSLSGRISPSDVRTAVVEESLPGDSGERFLEEMMEILESGDRSKVRSKGAPLRGERFGGGRKLLSDNVQTSGGGVTLSEESSSPASKKWGGLSKGAWVGIAIAIVFFVGAISILCWCLECVCCCCCCF